jgi:hypothetical protein
MDITGLNSTRIVGGVMTPDLGARSVKQYR